MIRITSSGDWRNTFDWLKRTLKGDFFGELDRYGRMGVEALSRATPVNTGATASAWYYRVISDRTGHRVEWHNDEVDANGTPIVIMLQYGHGTGTGGYVQGRDFINPAIRPVMDQIANEIWKKVIA